MQSPLRAHGRLNMEYQIIWFILWGVLWSVYFMLDGFDLGAGMLQPFITRNEDERQVVISSIGSVWDGNQVWLITAGGATFAAFPTTYALMFSYLYTALLAILFALIIRGVALELRHKEPGLRWRKNWDIALSVSSLLPALLFGVAFGNIFEGLPMDGNGYHGTLFTLLNPYGLITGVLFVMLFLMHGTLWIAFRTSDELSERCAAFAGKIWIPLAVVAITFLIATKFFTGLYNNLFSFPVFLVLPVTAVSGLLMIKVCISRKKILHAFLASCVFISMVCATGIAGLYPNLIPSSMDPAFSLTIFNTSSSVYTLKIMTGVALLFVPLVIAYQIWKFRIFRSKITAADRGEGY
jgi:cytochrome bd ubiquinol oxidase subunit II